MKAKLFFLTKVFTLTIFFFVLWPKLERIYVDLIATVAIFLRGLLSTASLKSFEIESFYFIIPFLSVLIAANGIPIRHKLKWLALGLIFFIAFDILTVASGITALASQIRSGAKELTLMSELAGFTYQALCMTLPFLALLVALGGKLDQLWASSTFLQSSRICPICGKGKTGLVEHIRSVHGEKALKSWRVKRHLTRTGRT